MRGKVLHYDSEHGFGFVQGSDARRYAFDTGDMRRAFPIDKGTAVEFTPDGDKARDIFPLRAERAATAAASAFGRSAVVGEPEDTSLWGYFWRGLTVNYASFRPRARRKEYWGYTLFYYLSWLVVVFLGLAIDQALGTLDSEGPYATFALGGLYFFATAIPFIALAVRRQHDIGLSGWFYLLIFVPYIGGLIVLVFALIPSQMHENKWGPIPYGIA